VELLIMVLLFERFCRPAMGCVSSFSRPCGASITLCG
jgi:hypothetical protein